MSNQSKLTDLDSASEAVHHRGDRRDTLLHRYGEGVIERAALLIAGGQSVAIATETVYGLAVDASNSLAVGRIYAAKGRPDFNPLIIHVADLAAGEKLGIFGEVERQLAAIFWPGPLTMIVPRRADCSIAAIATAGLDSIALRVPAHRAMRALLRATGKPLAAPSANASGTISPTRAQHVLRSLEGRIAMVIDDGACSTGLESTIVAVAADHLAILRPGPITSESLGRVVALPVVEAQSSAGSSASGAASAAAIIAPGQLTRHYAPSKPLRLNAVHFEPHEYGIGFGSLAGDSTLSASGDLVEAAARLFDLLHCADASEKPAIAVACLDSGGAGNRGLERNRSDAGLSCAIADRLQRAACPA